MFAYTATDMFTDSQPGDSVEEGAMIKMKFLVNRRPELTRDQFCKHWREKSGPIGSKIPGLRKYVQHHAIPGPDGAEPAYDGFAEMWWDDGDSLQRALESPEGKGAVEDIENIVGHQEVIVVEQYVMV